MAKFEIGDQVLNILSNTKGRIVKVFPEQRGRQRYYVSYADGTESETLEGRLTPVTDLSDPFERCKQKIFDTYSDFCLLNTTSKIFNSNNNTVSSLKASKTVFHAYQFKPLLKFLNSDNRKILVADEVGVGKTIEAGHIMLEMKSRNQLRNALIICPKGLLQVKWRDELQNKYGITFKIYEDKKDFIRDLEDREGSFKGIINYDKIRSQISGGEETNPILKYLKESGRSFDFVVFDEAHKLRNHTTHLYKGAELVVDCAKAVVMLTATPIMTRRDNLYRLLHLLEPDRFSDTQLFDNAIEENRPFIHALNSLNAGVPIKDIIEVLRSETIQTSYKIGEYVYQGPERTVDEAFGEIPLYKKIINDAETREDNEALRAEMQYNLSLMSPMNSLFSRTRKVEVTTDWSQPKRVTHTQYVTLYPEEQEKFDEIINNYIENNSYTDLDGEEKMVAGSSFGLVTQKRKVASSVYGTLNGREDLQQGIDLYEGQSDAKFNELTKIINTISTTSGKKLVVFAVFKNTLEYIHLRLSKMGIKSVLVHGDVKEREQVIANFQNDSSVRVLLTSEVSSEGIDLQFCDSIVNYDLPWNPMVVEQRIGRVDRIGQQSEVVNIYNIVVKGSILEDIYIRLLERIGIFRESIGDLEAILDDKVNVDGVEISLMDLFKKTEEELYRTKLTREEQEEKGRKISQAFENERLNLEHVKSGLSDTMTNDAYFKHEIERIVNHGSYVAEQEILNIVKKLFEKKLTTCSLNQVDDNLFDIVIPANDSRVLIRFLDNQLPSESDVDGRKLFGEYKNLLRDTASLTVTFNQEYAYRHKNVPYMNVYNPIVLSAASYFSRNLDENSKSFCLKVSAHESGLSAGHYLLAVYKMKLQKINYGILQESETLVPILYNLETQSIEDNGMLASKVFGSAQQNGQYLSATSVNMTDDEIETARSILADEIDEYAYTRKTEETIHIETDKQLQKQRASEMYERRIKNWEDRIAEKELELRYCYSEEERKSISSLINLWNGNLSKTKQDRDLELNKIDNMRIEGISHNIFSVSYINIE